MCRDFVEADFERCIDAYRIKNDLQSFVEKLQAKQTRSTCRSCPHARELPAEALCGVCKL